MVAPYTPTPITSPIKPYDACSCVSYAKWLSGIDVGPIGYAKYHPINSQTPQVGGLVIFSGGNGHMAVVVAVDNLTITIKESNWVHCQEGQRVIPKLSPNIIGYYNL